MRLFLSRFLEHNRDEVAGEPAPFNFTARGPLVSEVKAKALAIEVE